MAKTPRLKARNPSIHSRAARRAASPTNKTLASHVEEASEIRHVKQTQRYAGVSKKKAKGKPLTRAQRLRREKGIERAEVVIDQLEIKKGQSLGRSKKIKDRSEAWDDVNGKLLKSSKGQSGGFAALAGADADGWEDEEEDNDAEQDRNSGANGLDAVHEQEAIRAVTALKVSGKEPDTSEINGAVSDAHDDEEVL